MPVLLAMMILVLAVPFPAPAGADRLRPGPAERSGTDPEMACTAEGLLERASDVVAAWNDEDGQRFVRLMRPRSAEGAGWLAFTEPGGASEHQAVDNIPGLIAARAREEDRLTVAVASIAVEPLGQPAWGLYGEVPVGRSVAGQPAAPHTMLLFLDCGSGRLDGVAIRQPGHIVRTAHTRKLVSPCTEAMASAPFEALITAINAGEERIIRTLVATRAEAEAIPVYRRFAFALPDAADRERLLFANVMDPVPALADWAGHGRRLELLTYDWDIDRTLDDAHQVWATFEGIYRDGAGVAWPMQGKVGVDCANGRVNALDLGAA